MLLIKPLCFSASASARLSLNVPAAENSFCWVFSLPDHLHGLAPSMPSPPEYGELDVPNVPKNRSLTSNEPVPNCFELKATCTSSGRSEERRVGKERRARWPRY